LSFNLVRYCQNNCD